MLSTTTASPGRCASRWRKPALTMGWSSTSTMRRGGMGLQAAPARGTRIETRRRSKRPARWLLPLGYAAAYFGLYQLSSVYWFLPAGLRLAVLWMAPRRDWWLLALGDVGVILAITEYRGIFTMP